MSYYSQLLLLYLMRCDITLSQPDYSNQPDTSLDLIWLRTCKYVTASCVLGFRRESPQSHCIFNQKQETAILS